MYDGRPFPSGGPCAMRLPSALGVHRRPSGPNRSQAGICSFSIGHFTFMNQRQFTLHFIGFLCAFCFYTRSLVLLKGNSRCLRLLPVYVSVNYTCVFSLAYLFHLLYVLFGFRWFKYKWEMMCMAQCAEYVNFYEYKNNEITQLNLNYWSFYFIVENKQTECFTIYRYI